MVGVGVVGVVGVHALLEVGEEDPPAVEILEELHLDGARGVVIGRVGVVRDAHTSPCGSLRGERLAGGVSYRERGRRSVRQRGMLDCYFGMACARVGTMNCSGR